MQEYFQEVRRHRAVTHHILAYHGGLVVHRTTNILTLYMCALTAAAHRCKCSLACGNNFPACERDRAAIVLANSIGNCKIFFGFPFVPSSLVASFVPVCNLGEQGCLGLNEAYAR